MEKNNGNGLVNLESRLNVREYARWRFNSTIKR